jgi:hypothetical protein
MVGAASVAPFHGGTGVAGCGVTRYGEFRQGGQGAARSVGVRCGMAVEVCQGQARSGAVGQGGQGRLGATRHGVARCG